MIFGKEEDLKGIIIFCSILLALHAVAYCGQVNRILLFDGSIINGEIVAYENGIYVIRTANLGEIKVESAKVFRIDSISYPSVGTPATSATQSKITTQSRIDSLRQELMSDPESAAIIMTLAADPEIQEMAKDPWIQDAVKSGDIQALMKNETFMDKVNNPSVQDAVKRLKQ